MHYAYGDAFSRIYPVSDRSLENVVASRIIILADDRSGKRTILERCLKRPILPRIRKDYLEVPSSSIHNSFSFRLAAMPYDALRTPLPVYYLVIPRDIGRGKKGSDGKGTN